MNHPCVYILTNRTNRVLYTGVTASLPARIMQHRSGKGSSFCTRYNITKLVHIEFLPTMIEAIAREKAIKEWQRAWKIALIEAGNPDWKDLFDQLNA